jgi:hypothetical protein
VKARQWDKIISDLDEELKFIIMFRVRLRCSSNGIEFILKFN